MTTYLLRDIPDEIHGPATARAAREGHPLRWVLIAALRDYAEGAWAPSAAPESAPRKPATTRRSGRRPSGRPRLRPERAVTH